MANSVDANQTAPIGAVCSGSTLFASIYNSSVMLGNYLQQTTSADDIIQMHLRVSIITRKSVHELQNEDKFHIRTHNYMDRLQCCNG